MSLNEDEIVIGALYYYKGNVPSLIIGVEPTSILEVYWCTSDTYGISGVTVGRISKHSLKEPPHCLGDARCIGQNIKSKIYQALSKNTTSERGSVSDACKSFMNSDFFSAEDKLCFALESL